MSNAGRLRRKRLAPSAFDAVSIERLPDDRLALTGKEKRHHQPHPARQAAPITSIALMITIEPLA